MNTRKLHQTVINFALKSEFICPILITSSNLVLEIISVKPLLKNQINFGTVQPIFFVRELGFVEGQDLRVQFDKNLINIQSDHAVNYRLRFTPYRKVDFQIRINIFEILLPETVIVATLSNELFLGSL